jgi:hypothetical protein
MNRQKMILATAIIALILVVAAVGGLWQQSLAAGTIPTRAPTPAANVPTNPPGKNLPGATATAASAQSGQPQPTAKAGATATTPPLVNNTGLGTVIDGAGNIGLAINNESWGGITLSGFDGLHTTALEFFLISADSAPHPEQLQFTRQILAVAATVKGKPVKGEVAEFKVYFDLSANERFLLNNYPASFGVYWYDDAKSVWELCPASAPDETASPYGRLSCATTHAGFFALGDSSAAK